MSTRWYPLYQKGNPQLRVFLPNFWMKMIKGKARDATPPNTCQFSVSMEMTKYDVKNYLEKIYNVEVVYVNLVKYIGKFKRAPAKSYIIKDDDYKVAFVTFPTSQSFVFPDMFPQEDQDKEDNEDVKRSETMHKEWDKNLCKQKDRKGIPSFFGL